MKYITVAPTWEGLLPMLIELSRKATTAEARKTAMDELVRMARIADKAVEEAKAREAEMDNYEERQNRAIEAAHEDPHDY